MMSPRRLTTAAALLAATLVAAPQAHARLILTWLNETDTSLEGDRAKLDTPPAITINAGDTTPDILGSLYEPGVTDPAGPGAVVAQLGVGPFASDPRSTPWTWSAATFNTQLGTDDQYTGALTVSTPGTYAYTYRFSTDAGTTWTLADLDGAGSLPGLSFSPAQLGTLNVLAPHTPEPTTLALLALTTPTLLLRRRRSS